MKWFKSSFSKIPQHARFEYKPIYYNPEEEERKARRDKKRLGKGVFTSQRGGRKNSIFNASTLEAPTANTNSGQLLRTIAIVGIMLSIIAYLLKLISPFIAIGLLICCLFVVLKSIK